MRIDVFVPLFLMCFTISCDVNQIPTPPPIEFKAAPEECPAACKAIEDAKCDLSGTDETCLAFCLRMETGSNGTYLNPRCQKTIKTCSEMDRCMANNAKPAASAAGSPGVVNPKDSIKKFKK